ncbi:16553_t:CDS:1, partial [Dentiscutata erythropus]
MNEKSQDFMFTAQSCLYCHFNLTCDNQRKDFDTQNCLCEHMHKRCQEDICDTCCDYARCLIIQYPTCENERRPREMKVCDCEENHDRCQEDACVACCNFYNKIVSCRNCYLQGRKCEWSRIMCRSDFEKQKNIVKYLQFYSAGFERGGLTGKLHLQGYIQFDTRVRGSYVKSHFGQNLHIDIPKFNPPLKLNSKRKQKSGAECRFEYSVKRYDRCMTHIRCSCSYIDLNDVCDDCLPTKEECIRNRRSLDITDMNGVVLEKYIFGELNTKIGTRKSSRKRQRENDEESMISENSDRDGYKNPTHKRSRNNNTQDNEKVEKYVTMLNLLGKGENAYTILKKNPSLFMRASQLKALEPGAQHENLKSKIVVTSSRWKPHDFLIPKIVNDWIEENVLSNQNTDQKKHVLVLKNGTGKWSLVESLTNYGIRIAHFRNEFQPSIYDSKNCDLLCLDNIHDFTIESKANGRVFNHRKYAQLLLGKDRILINQKNIIERSVPIVILCTDNTCPFTYNCSTEDENFLKRFFSNTM